MANPAFKSAASTADVPAYSVVKGYFTPSGAQRKRIFYHILFWVLYCLFVCLLFFNFYNIRRPGFYLQILSFFPAEILLVYFNFYVLMPRFLFTKKYWIYGILFLAGIALVGFINVKIGQYYGKQGYKEFAEGLQFTRQYYLGRMMELFYVMGFTTSVKLARNWMSHLQWIKEKEKQYLETELNFLKSQIQPHFFFNTLNNLYSLTLKKSDQAPEVVLKLSDLMSYMLYESGSGRVALDKEIAYLQNYIDVEKLRFGQRLEVSFETNGNTEQVFIPPMVLILFLENSFKHGVKNNVDHIHIYISLKIEKGFLYFQVTNPVSMHGPNPAREGIGLKNVRRRLDLLFGKNYTLHTEEKDQQYFVSLIMPVW